MKLIGNKILVKKLPLSKHSESGIYTPSEKSYDFKVLLIGNRVEHIKPGDVIRKQKFSDGIQIIYEGEDCLILNAKRDVDILFFRI